MVQVFTFILALWTLILSMPLCVSGVVKHPCTVGHATDCPHEASCAQDPCSLKMTPSGSWQQLTQHPLVMGPLLPAVLASACLFLSAGLPVHDLTVFLPRHGSSYPSGLFPLLI
jgi:hypothetical protein